MATYYIGCSTDDDIRFHSSSGGVGTAIIKHLLDNKEYGTAMTFYFDKKQCKYFPKLIYSFDDYHNCGSIYQDTDNIGFIRDNIERIENGIIITCMPCQVKPIQSILRRSGIKCFIISMCCSGQTTVQGTWCYYSLLGLRKENINSIQYRGNGWPSGIQISLDSGELIKYDNYTYPWTLIHKSLLFRPKRCLYCTIKTSPEADVSLADPWLKEYLENDPVGHSVIICNPAGNIVIQQMLKTQLLNLKEVDESVYVQSQLGTIQEKSRSNKYKLFNRIVSKMGDDRSIYKKCMTSSAFLLKQHLHLLRLLRSLFVK